MKAITTHYLGVTATRPARIRAEDLDGNQVTISWPSDCESDEDAHRRAAGQFMETMGWSGDLQAGAIRGGYAFVITKLPSTVRTMLNRFDIWSQTDEWACDEFDELCRTLDSLRKMI